MTNAAAVWLTVGWKNLHFSQLISLPQVVAGGYRRGFSLLPNVLPRRCSFPTVFAGIDVFTVQKPDRLFFSIAIFCQHTTSVTGPFTVQSFLAFRRKL